MSDWEDNDHNNISVRVPKPNKWDDEDAEEEDVKDNWDESSDEEATTSAAAPKKKISAAQKAIAKKLNNNDGNEEEDELERKRREQQAIKDADMENAKEMFQGISIKETEVDKVNSKKLNNAVSSQSVTTKETSSPLDKINPKTKEDFDRLSKLLIERIRKHEKHHLYVNFINGLVRELCLPLKETEVRKIANTLTTLADQQKPKPKKKSNSKPVLQVENFDSVDAADYVEYVYDEYDDFM